MGLLWESDETDEEFGARIRRELEDLGVRQLADARDRGRGRAPAPTRPLTDADRELLRRFYISPE